MKAARPPMMTARMRLLERLLKLMIRTPASPSPDSAGIAPRKLLMIKLSGLGDAVMVRALIEHLRRRNPVLKIGILGGPSTIEALSYASDFQVHSYRPDQSSLMRVFKLLREIRRSGYDTLIDFEPYSMLTAGFGKATGIRHRIGFAGLDGSSRARLFTHPVPINDQVKFWNNFVSLTKAVAPDLKDVSATLPLPLSESVEQWMDNWLRKELDDFEQRHLVALHLGAAPRMAYRCWPVEKFVELANTLNDRLPHLTIVLTGTRLESDVIDRFRANYSGSCLDGSALVALEYTAALLRRCQLLISNDTGVMHLGAALDVKTLGLFGASNPVHWAPEGSYARYLYITQVNCSPCIDVYHRRAPIHCFNPDYQRCMNDISPAIVCKTALTLLGERF